jgi:hypothetical protein
MGNNFEILAYFLDCLVVVRVNRHLSCFKDFRQRTGGVNL